MQKIHWIYAKELQKKSIWTYQCPIAALLGTKTVLVLVLVSLFGTAYNLRDLRPFCWTNKETIPEIFYPTSVLKFGAIFYSIALSKHLSKMYCIVHMQKSCNVLRFFIIKIISSKSISSDDLLTDFLKPKTIWGGGALYEKKI